ncbi:hypothetical protein ABH942_002693 [Flavobacterium sp. 28YEA47A]|uniref:hypothetical protein n=1 Tax=Flavobacterium sp. 28YEA47A TaxID=3156276 RepID=UPI0035167679
MKKILLTLFTLCCINLSFGQTLLASHPLELKKATSYHQIINAVNNQNQVFAFASDKEKLKVLKFSNALFFKDSLSVSRPDKSYEAMVGFSFEDNGNPYLYWSSEDYTKIQSLYFDFNNRTSSTASYQVSFKNEDILSVFSENNSFYILSLIQKEDKLKFYCFNKGQLEEKTVDFSSFKFIDENGKSSTFSKLIKENAIEKIDTRSSNPLFQSVSKIKFYVTGKQMVLTFDATSRTQLFDIDLTTFAISEKTIPSLTIKGSGAQSNSYLHNNKLYQIKANGEELAIAAADVATGEQLKNYTATPKDSISFRNSPLYSQTGNQRGQELKTTKKFFQRLNNSYLGITVYKTPASIMVTAGGIRDVSSTGGILLGLSTTVAMAVSGSYYAPDDMFDSQNMQTVYFEGLFDDKFEHKKGPQQGLAVDYISQFLYENNVSLVSVFPYKDYFIMGYYDSKKKEYALRKFEDSND